MTENSFQIVSTWKQQSDQKSITIKASFHSALTTFWQDSISMQCNVNTLSCFQALD